MFAFAPKLPKKVLYAQLALLIANFIWGAAGPVIKLTLEYIPPFTFLFLRFLLVGIILLPYAVYKLHREPVDRKDIFNFVLLGLFSQSSIALVFVALKYTTVLDYTIISVLGSVLSVYAGHYFYKEKVSRQMTIGLIIASIGTLFIIMEPAFADNASNIAISSRIFGNALGLIYGLAWLIYVIWSKFSMGERSKILKKSLSFVHIKPMVRKYSPSLIVTLSFYVGIVTLLPFAVLERMSTNGYPNFDLFALNPTAVFGLLFMVIFSSIIAYMLSQWAFEYAKVADTAIYSYLSTIFTFPFAFWLLGEVPNKYMLVGAAFIALGVILAECAPNHD